jgi:hypothetical protein
VAKPFSKFWQKQFSQNKKKTKEYATEYFLLILAFCAKKRKKKGDYLLLGYYQLPKSRSAAGPLP